MIIQTELTKKQAKAWALLTDDKTSYLLFGGGAGGGKSWLGCLWLTAMCFEYPGSKWFVGRKELKRLMASTYITFLKVFKELKIPNESWRMDGKYNYIEFVSGRATGSRIDLLDLAPQPSDPQYERFGSLEYTGGWIEEAGEIEFICFDILKTRVGRYRNREFGLLPAKILLTCNPTQNWLYRIFYKPFKSEKPTTTTSFIQSLYKDNPYTASEYGSQLNNITDSILRARLRDGLWEYTADNLTLCKYDAILELFVNPPIPDNSRYLSADIARFGADKIVYGIWQGYNLIDVQEKTKQAQTITEQEIRDLMTKNAIPYNKAVVDEDGMGGGVVDHLYGINGFMGGRSAIKDLVRDVKDNYKNLRSQCYFILAEKINKHEIAITAKLTETQREQLISDLQQVKRVDLAADAPLQVIPKEEIRESLGRSPDYSDMMMMRCYIDLLKQPPSYNAPNKDKIMGAGALSEWGGVEGYGI